MKRCSKCRIKKDFSDFGKNKKSKDGLKSACKECLRIDWKEYYNKNKEKVLKKNKKYLLENPDKKKEIDERYRESEKRKNYIKEWCKNNRNKIKKYSDKHRFSKKGKQMRNRYRRERLKKDINFKLRSYISSYISRSIKGYKFLKTEEYLGCSIEKYKIYLENLFQEKMSWKNYGEWHIDHIKPLSLFDLKEEATEAFHYINTQPLWAKENIIKSNNFCK